MDVLDNQENLNMEYMLDDIKKLLLILLGKNGTVIMFFFFCSYLLEISWSI